MRLFPEPGARQEIILLLNEVRSNGAPPRCYSFGPVASAGAGATVKIKTPGVAPGAYLIRVQVDGIASRLAVDTDPVSPTFDLYTGPRVEIA